MSKITFDDKELKEVIFVALKEKIGSAINYQEMHQLIGDVISERSEQLQTLMLECLDDVLADKTMRETIRDEFKHKVAKNMVGKLEGAVEKSVNAFRQNPTLNAKLIMAVENVIKDNTDEL